MNLDHVFKKTLVRPFAGIRKKPEVPEGLLCKCSMCKKAIVAEDVRKNFYVCPSCNGYFRVRAQERIARIADEGSFLEWDQDLVGKNPMEFEGYEEKIAAARLKTRLKEAVVTGQCTIGGEPCVLCVMDGRFMMASMGEAVGEKITRAAEEATKKLLIAGTPQEDPAVIAAASDLVLYADEAAQGDTIMEKCADWGIDVFVHYSFPRHMAMELIVARHELLKKNADALGIEMVDVTAPDPTAEAGLSASQQFILEDVPQQLKKYEGKKVAFFTTNCGMQPSLQTACLDEPNAYYPQPCCPSPYHAFPATLGLELAIGGDDEDALKQIAAKLKEHDAVGRFSTWASPVAMTIIAVGVDYAKGYITGEITDRNDADKLVEMFNSKVEGAKINNYTNAEGETFDNYYTILLAPVDFNDYL